MFLGDDLLAWMVLALGGAMLIGNVGALVRTNESPKEGELARAPVVRSLIMGGVGLFASVWAFASLVS
ncbi:MAG: hypothetical protein ACC652_12015 [Acidimicrobiales bacterium]